MRTLKKQAGFTLVELVIAVLVVGILSIVLAPTFRTLTTSQKGLYSQKQVLNNQLIGSALMMFAHDNTTTGTLPAPYTGGGYTSTVYNPSDVSVQGLALTAALNQSGMNPSEINNDNYASQRVRVFQLVSGLTKSIPLYFQSGPALTVTYQFGAIYQTACSFSTASCNPTAATGVPGTSPLMTTANYTTWTTVGTDLPPYFVSTLPLQKQMLATTAQRLDKIRDSLLGFLRSNQVTAAGDDTTNWFPNPGTMGAADPATNQGCRDGWYDLSTSTVVLPLVGLSQQEFGVTAWGAPIQYCRDYDPTVSKTPNTPPHYAAIRFNKAVSQGLAPDAVVFGNNVVLTF